MFRKYCLSKASSQLPLVVICYYYHMLLKKEEAKPGGIIVNRKNKRLRLSCLPLIKRITSLTRAARYTWNLSVCTIFCSPKWICTCAGVYKCDRTRLQARTEFRGLVILYTSENVNCAVNFATFKILRNFVTFEAVNQDLVLKLN